MKIRRAGMDDANAIANLYIQLKEHHLELAPGMPRYDQPDEDWLEKANSGLRDGSLRFYVAEQMEITGFVKLFFEEKSWGLVCEVETLVIDEQARARGIGTALMRHAEQVARDEGAIAMRVNVLRHNSDGRRFYERDGYRPIAVRYGKTL